MGCKQGFESRLSSISLCSQPTWLESRGGWRPAGVCGGVTAQTEA